MHRNKRESEGNCIKDSCLRTEIEEKQEYIVHACMEIPVQDGDTYKEQNLLNVTIHEIQV